MANVSINVHAKSKELELYFRMVSSSKLPDFPALSFIVKDTESYLVESEVCIFPNFDQIKQIQVAINKYVEELDALEVESSCQSKSK